MDKIHGLEGTEFKLFNITIIINIDILIIVLSDLIIEYFLNKHYWKLKLINPWFECVDINKGSFLNAFSLLSLISLF